MLECIRITLRKWSPFFLGEVGKCNLLYSLKRAVFILFTNIHVKVYIQQNYIYIDALRYFAKQKISYYFGGEISYPDVSNYQSKLLNKFYMSKSYRILNFMIFLAF
jgi:hypothetical protein